ncbi:hypothetical protein NIES4101_79290 [Calothrix sp. NIES-4101]|nr:hypothetical protein NIES4101_79290 [Calothrix sp. NIES-4101]
MTGVIQKTIFTLKKLYMSSSEKEYFEIRNKKTKRLRNIVTAVSILSFFGSSSFAVIGALQQAHQNIAQVDNANLALQNQVQSYELVLQREPGNRLALEGLVNTRLQMNDTNGAIESLEKLTKLYPQEQAYKLQIEQLKKHSSK